MASEGTRREGTRRLQVTPLFLVEFEPALFSTERRGLGGEGWGNQALLGRRRRGPPVCFAA